MGWFRKEDESKVPEEFRGKSAEEIVDLVKKGRLAEDLGTKSEELKKAKEAAEAKLTEHTNTLTEMQTRMRQLEANQRPAPEKKNDEPIDFTIDPEGAVNERIKNATLPVAMAVLQSNSQLARMNAKVQLDKLRFQGTKISKGALFERYSGDIDALAKTTAIQSLQAPESWIHLFNMVVGQKMDEILSSQREGKFETMFSESGAGSGDVDRHVNEEHTNDKLSPEEERIAKRMGIKPEEYLKNKKAMVMA